MRTGLDGHACADPPSTDVAPKLQWCASPDRIFTKPGYVGLSDDPKRALPERVTLAGIDTDRSVRKVAMDVFGLGIPR